ncbi:GldG family protein [Laspinema olomoucense]|uniref:Gldg family protein n=1 Tax=Laspinema olomoucense D3b TaxID=2953688 RepID=A0ABT2NEX2_9CYAN|nr:Gldg family protein [Laspinema sp. D3b]MCT7981250.1 Gldg family protein [Laspinema sp. D3b]
MKTIEKKPRGLTKYFKYAVYLGLFLTIGGAIPGFLTGWQPVTTGLVIAGVTVLVLWLLWMLTNAEGGWNPRSAQAGTNAFVATASVLVILGLINFLGVRYTERFDLTENQRFTLAPQSQQLVRNLPQPVKVWVFAGEPERGDLELLENYRSQAPDLFDFQYVDPSKQPTVARQFGVQSFGEVYLTSEDGTRQQFVQTVSSASSLSEARLTSSLEQFTSDRVYKVYLLQGHGERSLEAGRGAISQAVASLKDKNFLVEPLNLARLPRVPPDAAVVVIAGPRQPLFPQEVQALRTYLQQGGSLFVAIDPDTNTGLDPLLKEWGIQLDKTIAIDSSGSGGLVGLGPAAPLITNYGDHPIVRDFQGGYSFYPLARPLLLSDVEGVKSTPLLLTGEQSWAESTPENPDLKFDPQGDRPGPLPLGVAKTRAIATDTPTPETATPEPTTPEPTTPEAETDEATSPEAETDETATPETATPETATPETATPETATPEAATPETTTPETATPETTAEREARLVVIGNSEFAIDGNFQLQLNGDVFLNSVSWLSKQNEQTLSIRPKTVLNRRISMTPQEAQQLAWAAVGFLPLFGLLTAAIFWWKRR